MNPDMRGYDPSMDQRRADPELGGLKPEIFEQSQFLQFQAGLEAMQANSISRDSVWQLAMQRFPEADSETLRRNIMDAADAIEFGPLALKNSAEKIRMAFKE